jgi:PilZ domain
MSRFAAVFCHDAPSLRILTASLNQAGIDHVICRSQQQALELALSGHCSLLLADFVLPGAGEVARVTSLLPPAQKPVVLAIAGEYPGTGEAFQSGANRILYRPLASAQVRDALHEKLASGRKPSRHPAGKRSHAKMPIAKNDRRATSRTSMTALVYLELETGVLPAIGIDLSEQGLAVQAAEPIPACARMRFRCLLPGATHSLRGQADVIWTDDHGRAGMFFSHLPPSSRKLLKHWLARHRANNANPVRVLLPPAGAALFS